MLKITLSDSDGLPPTRGQEGLRGADGQAEAAPHRGGAVVGSYVALVHGGPAHGQEVSSSEIKIG